MTQQERAIVEAAILVLRDLAETRSDNDYSTMADVINALLNKQTIVKRAYYDCASW